MGCIITSTKTAVNQKMPANGVVNIQMPSFSLFSTFNIILLKIIYSLLALAIQPWTSHKVSTQAQLPSYTAANLPPMSRRNPGLHNSFTANWLLLKEAPQGKQRALEILMPLTTLETHPLQKPPLSYSHPLFSSFFLLSNTPTLFLTVSRLFRAQLGSPVSHSRPSTGC